MTITLNISSGNYARSLSIKSYRRLVSPFHHNRNTLEVKQYLHYVFLNTFNSTVFMLNTVDFNFNNGAASHRRQQNASQCISQSMSEPSLERLQNNLGMCGIVRCYIDISRCKHFGCRILHNITCKG